MSEGRKAQRVGPAGLSHQSTAASPFIWDGKILALTQLLSINQTWMQKNVHEYPVVWGYCPALVLCCLSKQFTKAQMFFTLSWGWREKERRKKNKTRLAKDVLLSWIIGIRSPCKSLDFMFTFCLLASSTLGRTYCPTFRTVGLDNGMQAYGSSWPRPKVELCARVLWCGAVFYLCGKLLHHESFQTSRRSFINRVLTNKFPENRQSRMSGH